jgi:glycosyltransferase involved in cell wall biosynthesis
MVARLLRILSPSLKVVSTVHSVYEGGRMRMLAYRLTDTLACRTTAVSQAAADRFVRLKAVRFRNCIVLPNGIDIAEFAPDAERRRRMRAAMDTGENFIWIAVGRMVPAKDYPNLLRAFTQLRAVFPDAQLWIAGAPGLPNTFNAGSESMENVHLLGLRRDMPALLDAADGFVQASAWEGMPLAVGEAMAMEKPVVATDAGGTRQLVGDASVLVAPQDSNALAAAMIHQMRSSAELRQAQGRVHRARINEQFGIDARADTWEALYRSLIVGRA